MRAFVAGATGVIGRRVVPLLLQAGYGVTAIGRTPEKRAALARMGAAATDADLFSPDALRAAVAGHDVVINVATHMPSSLSRILLPGAWTENDRVRRVGSATPGERGHRGRRRAIRQGVFRPRLSRPRRSVDRGGHADRAGSVQPNDRRCGEVRRALHREGAVRNRPAFRSFLRSRRAVSRRDDPFRTARTGADARPPGELSFVDLARRRGERRVGGIEGPGGRLQRRRRPAGHAPRVFRFARSGARSRAAQAPAGVDDSSLRIRRKDVGALAPHLQPQTARSNRMEAEISECAGRLARGRGRIGRGPRVSRRLIASRERITGPVDLGRRFHRGLAPPARAT